MDAVRKRRLEARAARDLRFTAQQAEMPFAQFVLGYALFMGVSYFLFKWLTSKGSSELMDLALESAFVGVFWALWMRIFMKWYHRHVKHKYEVLRAED